MQRFLQALQFLTIFRFSPGLPGEHFREGELARSAPFFPLVGLVIGAASYLLFRAASIFLPPEASVLVLVLAPAVLSGGLHMDGLSDFCDGFFSGRTERWEILKIMKDSRIGVMGTLGIVFVLLAKYHLFAGLTDKAWFLCVVFAASRSVQVGLAYFMPYAGDETGMGRGFVGEISKGELVSAVLAPLALGLPLGIPMLFTEAIFVSGLVALLAVVALRKLGGATGDVCGAASELAEVVMLAVAAAWWRL